MMQFKRTLKITENLRMQISFLIKTLTAILQSFHYKTMTSDSKEIFCHRSAPWSVILSAQLKRKLILKEE